MERNPRTRPGLVTESAKVSPSVRLRTGARSAAQKCVRAFLSQDDHQQAAVLAWAFMRRLIARLNGVRRSDARQRSDRQRPLRGPPERSPETTVQSGAHNNEIDRTHRSRITKPYSATITTAVHDLTNVHYNAPRTRPATISAQCVTSSSFTGGEAARVSQGRGARRAPAVSFAAGVVTELMQLIHARK